MFGTIRMGASFPAMLSQQLAEADYDVIGLAANVPHYLGDTDYPDAVISLLDGLSRHTGLDLPSTALESNARLVRTQIDESVAASPDAGELIAEYERRHDAAIAELSSPEEMGDLPSADELGAEAEEFLRRLGDL